MSPARATRLLCPAVATTLLAALVPASASAARRPEPLVDLAPLNQGFQDRVIAPSARGARARAAATTPFRAYATRDGRSVQLAFSSRYVADRRVAESYVGFLDSLPHGSELGRLKVLVAPPDEVQRDCGGQPGTLACYGLAEHLMIVPGQQSSSSGGVTVSYVVTHEYGHHVAAFRANPPFEASDFGPKYWASYERVCERALDGRLAPGDEGSRYAVNPGENWAETYARLRYPRQPWTFASLLRPDARALAAARRDVLTPWRAPRSTTFTGSFPTTRSHTRRYAFDLRLDGPLTVRLRGPRRANFDLTIAASGRTQGRTKAPGSRDALSYPAACRTRATERITVTVRRISGRGPFRLQATYPG